MTEKRLGSLAGTAVFLPVVPYLREHILRSLPVLFALVFCCMLSACGRQTSIEALTGILVSDQWGKEVGQDLLREKYVYTFMRDGTYNACAFSHFGTRPMKGKWQMTRDKDGSLHLRIYNEEAYYFWLWHDSVLTYDKRKDALIVSGPYYGREEAMHRVIKKQPTGELPRYPHQKSPQNPKPRCRVWTGHRVP